MSRFSWSGIVAAVSGGRCAVRRTASWWLSAELSSVGRARRLTRRKLTAWGFGDQVEVAELLVSELVGNAVEHGCGRVRLSFVAEDGLLRCEVEDEDPELPRMGWAEVDDEGGRGLFLVDVLSCCWGGVRTSRGKAVWFELPASAHAEAEVGSLDALAAFAV
ncbi:ATP-binding protein [Nonomuraea sp. H19]|uniref:ATP-binding protein n=1 Tax=Nonomuraea sp. H19 TaxID=3452206 RepID=UPI003F8A123B